MSDKKSNIVKFNTGFRVNIGIFLIIILGIYVIYHIFTLATKKEITIFEVPLGTIVEKNFYQGMAIRSEEIINADIGGNIYYYENNKSRVGVKSPIYAIDSKGDIISKLKAKTEGSIKFKDSDMTSITPVVESYIGGFEEVSFFSTYSFKTDVSDQIADVLVSDMAESYAQDIDNARASGTYFDRNAPKPGYLVYTVDGYEGKDIESFTKEDFNAGGISVENLRNREIVNAGDPAYKLITSDDWKLIIPVPEDKAKELYGINNVNIRFTQDNSKTWAVMDIIDREGDKYLVLSMDDSMERYANQRFVNVELLLAEKKGLKIPNSAITEKDFYVIPKSYFFYGANSNELGIMVRRDKKKDEFFNPTIYYENEDNYYIDNENVSAGDRLIMENSTSTYTVGANTDRLKGVYNVNKGYAVFKAVDILYNNEDYSIVRNQMSYGVSLYDHVVLDSSVVKENEIL